ncbi:MAG TPA: hypothetical protein VMV51_10530 [Gemmatimonadaceae bacterium]|nr:hypothetical protein [Gemmatimonadaceae bacterium]
MPSGVRSARAHVLGVRAGLGLGERVGGERVAARQRGQVARLLFRGAELRDGLGAEPAVHADQHRQAGVDARHFAEHAGVAAGRQPGATILGGNRESEQSGRGQRPDHRFGHRLLLVDGGRVHQVVFDPAQPVDQGPDAARLAGVAAIQWRGKRKEQ